MPTPHPSSSPDLRTIRCVRTVGMARDERWSGDREANEAMALGWVLLHVQTGPENQPVFVLGWIGDEEPKRTQQELEYKAASLRWRTATPPASEEEGG